MLGAVKGRGLPRVPADRGGGAAAAPGAFLDACTPHLLPAFNLALLLCGNREGAGALCEDALALTYTSAGRARGSALQIALLRSICDLSGARSLGAPVAGRSSGKAGNDPCSRATDAGDQGEPTMEVALIGALARLGTRARASVWLRDALGLTIKDAAAVVRAAVPRFEGDLHLARAALVDLVREGPGGAPRAGGAAAPGAVTVDRQGPFGAVPRER